MCLPLAAVAVAVTVASTAASVASQASAQSAAKKTAQNQADASNASAEKQSENDYQNTIKTEQWQDTTWQQDLDYATQTLGYDKQQFARQADYIQTADSAVVQNEQNAVGQQLLRQVQQNIHDTMQETQINRTAAQARASAQVQADARGAQGATVDGIINDVSRQQGDALNVMEMNRDAQNQQARVDLMNIKANSDSQLGQLESSVRTYAPSTPIRTPGPVNAPQEPTQYQTPVSSDNTGLQIAGGVATAAAGGLKTYDDVTGQTAKQTFSQVGNFLGIN